MTCDYCGDKKFVYANNKAINCYKCNNMNKSCNFCGRPTYKIKPWHTSPSEQIEHVCTGCNFNEEDCQCPAFISGISPIIPSVTEHYSPDEPPQPLNYGVPTGFPEHDDEPPRE